jgi:hypothetical protein
MPFVRSVGPADPPSRSGRPSYPADASRVVGAAVLTATAPAAPSEPSEPWVGCPPSAVPLSDGSTVTAMRTSRPNSSESRWVTTARRSVSSLFLVKSLGAASRAVSSSRPSGRVSPTKARCAGAIEVSARPSRVRAHTALRSGLSSDTPRAPACPARTPESRARRRDGVPPHRTDLHTLVHSLGTDALRTRGTTGAALRRWPGMCAPGGEGRQASDATQAWTAVTRHCPQIDRTNSGRDRRGSWTRSGPASMMTERMPRSRRAASASDPRWPPRAGSFDPSDGSAVPWGVPTRRSCLHARVRARYWFADGRLARWGSHVPLQSRVPQFQQFRRLC